MNTPLTPVETPIASLPLEVLSRILLLSAINWPPDGDSIVPWTSMRVVCVPWHTAIDGMPVFWRVISLPLSTSFVRKALSCSSQAPISQVNCNVESGSTIFPLIVHHAPRILRLHLHIFDVPSLEAGISQDYSTIRHLHLTSAIHDENNESIILKTTSACHSSLFRAHALTLECIVLPVTELSCFRDLCYLQLSYNLDSPEFTMPFVPFMDILSHIPTLQSLLLEMAFVVEATTPFHAAIDLPRLNQLHLKSRLPGAASLMRALHCPSLRRLQVDVIEHISDDFSARLLLSETRRLATSIPLPTTATLTGLPFTLPHSSTSFQHSNHEGLYVLLDIACWNRSMARNLRLVVEGMDLRELTTLTLGAHSTTVFGLPNGDRDRQDAWMELLNLTPNLYRLTIDDGGGAVEELPRALACKVTCGVLCPGLSIMCFTSGGFYRHQTREWLDCFRERQRHGYTLETLCFDKWSFPEHEPWIQDFREVCTTLRLRGTTELEFPDDLGGDSEWFNPAISDSSDI